MRNGSGGRTKDTKQKCKSAKYRTQMQVTENGGGKEKTIEQEIDGLDESLISDDSGDEFDSMLSSDQSLRDKLGADLDRYKKDSNGGKQDHFNDGLSDDEEYQKMSEKERNAKMRAKLNMDGANDGPDSDSDFATPPDSPEPTKRRTRNRNTKGNVKRRRLESESDDDDPYESPVNGKDDESMELPDIPEDSDNDEKPKKVEAEKEKPPKKIEDILTEEQRKNLVIPSKVPAVCGVRRRPTLIVTPATLIPHWLEQLQMHVDPRVELKVFVHHGTSKAHIPAELERQDIVLTTYGTLQAEHETLYPTLLSTKWLRICLDEGHNIKNHLAKTSKAAFQLNTLRKWIITGTPIQNNLKELWSLLKWLKFEPYCDEYKLYKRQIEVPIKSGDPIGFKRLQTLIEAVSLRRTKTDQVNGRPLVSLPKKTVRLKKLEFSEEERQIYDVFLAKWQAVIVKYQRRGTLLKNYAHVFAMMMRLRQLCCHRELYKDVNWDEVNMDYIAQQAEALAAEREAAKAVEGAAAGDEVEAKRLAESLRDMIKEGATDDCSICVGDLTRPVITPCAHVFCLSCITTVFITIGVKTCILHRFFFKHLFHSVAG